MYLNKQQERFIYYYKKIRKNTIVALILLLASKIFFLLYKIRFVLYKIKILKSFTLPAYIVSIGNLTSGGTGKTQLTIEAAKYFISQGYKVAVLCKGYKAKLNTKESVLLVSDGIDIVTTVDYSGDEAYLIAKNIPRALVFVSKDRVKAGKVAIKQGIEVLILDDSFQYLKLKRNINILLLDSYSPFDNWNLLPYGMLRESPSEIKRATSIVVSNADCKELEKKEIAEINKHAKNKPIVKISYKLTKLMSISTKKEIDRERAKGFKSIACCGLGNPNSFIDLLKRHEIDIKDFLIYPDHHNYEIKDFELITKVAMNHKVEDIIITEKDSVKIQEFCETLPITFWVAKVEIYSHTLNWQDIIFNIKT